MRALLICGLLTAAPLGAAAVHGPKEHSQPLPPGPNIKVLLEKDATSAFLEVRGGYRVIRKDSGTVLSFGNIGKRFVIHALQDGLRWGEEFPDVYQIAVIPTHPDTLMYVNGIQYKGAVSVYHVRDNRITVVNEVPIEDYLKSTLAIQYETPLQKEALAALVIAARTEVYARSFHSKASIRPWEITSQEVGYHGYGVTHQKNGVDEAVDSTRYMVLNSSTHTALAVSKAEELAKLGLNAKKILQIVFPNQSLELTIDANEIVSR